MQLNEASAINKLASMGMDDLPVMEYSPKRCVMDPDWFKKYTVLRRKFLESLTDSFEEIAFLNLSQEEFVDLVMGKRMPENTSLRFRIPLVWGGELSTDNMFLCLTFPHSHNLDKFIIDQSDAKTVFLPNPNKKIYLTTHLGGGGVGGNATSDRLSESAISFINSSRGNE